MANILTRFSACLVAVLLASFARADEKPNRIERTAKKAGDAVERTAKRAGKAVTRAARKTETWIEKKTQ